MPKKKKVMVTLPAYKAEKTLKTTIDEIPMEYVDQLLLVDDASPDRTVEVARELGLVVIVHEKNLGYGGNQKTCYTNALKMGADIVVCLHPDNQYSLKVENFFLRTRFTEMHSGLNAYSRWFLESVPFLSCSSDFFDMQTYAIRAGLNRKKEIEKILEQVRAERGGDHKV